MAKGFSTFMPLVFLWMWDFRGGDHDHQRGTLSKGKKKGRNGGRKMKYTPRDELSLSCSDYIGTKKGGGTVCCVASPFRERAIPNAETAFFPFLFPPLPIFPRRVRRAPPTPISLSLFRKVTQIETLCGFFLTAGAVSKMWNLLQLRYIA